MSASKPEVAERESWGNYFEFFLTSLGLAVGLGNVWRFPYVCYTNGGGSFLVPYLLMLVFVGIPGLWVEQSLGQYARVGANKAFGWMLPAFKGLGYVLMALRCMANPYYMLILSWSLFYLIAGLTTELPWGTCEAQWSSVDCFSIKYVSNCSDAETFFNQTCFLKHEYCKVKGFEQGLQDEKCVSSHVESQSFDLVLQSHAISPAEDYLNGRVLGLSKNRGGEMHNWSDLGSIQWELALSLTASWAIVIGILAKGLKSYGKVAYIITLSPYVVLTALLIYALMLPGAGDGIAFFLNPDWSRLLEVQIWANAAAQILFSLSVGFGSQMILSTYNRFENNTHRDAILIAVCNSLTSIYAGFVVFAILGFIAHSTQLPIEKVVQGGIGLAFVSYPSAVLEMDLSPLWSFLFFFMLLNLGLSSICGGMQTAVAFFIDEWPALEKHRMKIVVALSVFFLIVGLPMTLEGGIHIFTIFDRRTTSSLILLTFIQMVAVNWVFGVNNFFGMIKAMGIGIPGPVRAIWKIVLVVITPTILLSLTILRMVDRDTQLAYGDYVYPDLVQISGWIVELWPVAVGLVISLGAIVRLLAKDDHRSVAQKLFKPTAEWPKAETSHRDVEDSNNNEDNTNNDNNTNNGKRSMVNEAYEEGE